MRVWIETERVKRRWWFGHRYVFVVCTEFMRQQFGTRKEAEEHADTMRLLLKNTP